MRACLARFSCLAVCLAALATACGGASRVALTPLGQIVTASKEGPPPGSRPVGPVEATHGGGCGVFAESGNYEGAVSLLRNRVADLGGNFVQVLEVIEPHAEPTCFAGGYTARGVGYLVPGAPTPAFTMPAAPLPGAAPATAAPATPTLATAPTTSPPPSSAGACDPMCSPGYECKAGACVPTCNPPCEASEICNRHRMCEPAGPGSAPRSTMGPAPDAG